MTLEKAIEIVTINALEPGSLLPPDYLTALKLLIEAAKRLRALRIAGVSYPWPLLPGETTD